MNNQSRLQCVLYFISLNGTQTSIRALLASQGRRDVNVSSELMLQDLIWILAAVAPKGNSLITYITSDYNYLFTRVVNLHT